jgi:hypothetical protein
MDSYYILNIFLYAISLVYTIFMITYLGNAKKCDSYMEKRDKNFRQFALVITWINAVLLGLVIVMLIFKKNSIE